jgi:hypothetical protein
VTGEPWSSDHVHWIAGRSHAAHAFPDVMAHGIRFSHDPAHVTCPICLEAIPEEERDG